jgi:hypothetical protein
MSRLAYFRALLAIYKEQMPFILAAERAWIDARQPTPF